MTDTRTRRYEPVAVSAESTVVAEYIADPTSETSYQSESQLEAEFIRLLGTQAYEYLPIHTEAELVANLRTQLEALNRIEFTDSEWDRLFATELASANKGIIDKTHMLQDADTKLALKRDDGTTKNITLFDKNTIHANRLQVINQYEIAQGEGGAHHANRYDVTILVNGLPMVHVELKRRGVELREAFNQINRYQRDSFWAGSGLFEYVQLFVISNGTHTKYYSNTTRNRHLTDQNSRSRKAKTSDSFEFTSWWSDATNKPITDLVGFTKTFFAKHTLLNILARYCVFTIEETLMVMRPYQIVAAEKILNTIEVATNHHRLGTLDAGGYVWHTTGSGKTLTSFKTAQLATKIPGLDKVLFVVDRKDLDDQTVKEYKKFKKDSVNSNDSTAILAGQLADPGAKIIVTTIQKLSNFISANRHHRVYDSHVAIIFDECHRSQFGDMHTAITKAFKRYHLFGFTGTPIFAANSGTGGNPHLKTTAQAFGKQLHAYTIVDAITDKNVLPFRIDYLNTIQVANPDSSDDTQVRGIDTERALLAPQRIREIVAYTLEHFDQKTHRGKYYSVKDRRLNGFNALFATASVDAAKLYYQEFKNQQATLPKSQRLKVGLIYSYAPNGDTDVFADESFDTADLSASDRDFLESAIADYNQIFSTSFDTTSKGFSNYYENISNRLKSREIDLVIVVNMFLTGFDATTLNTLFADKNLRSHGLIQAFSRTNRILNSVKAYGTIVTFRNLQDETNAALELFGNKNAAGIVLLEPFTNYLEKYADKVDQLHDRFPAGEQIVGEQAQKDFVKLFGEILRLDNILSSFDEFAGNNLISDREMQDYRSAYLDLYNELRPAREADKEVINDDLVFEIELIKQVEINVDYILMLVEKYRAEHGDGDDKRILADISRAVAASPSLRNKKDLIEDFVSKVSITDDIDAAWQDFVRERYQAELEAIIADERLNSQAAEDYLRQGFRDGELRTIGTSITRVLPPMSRFSRDQNRDEKKRRVIDKLQAFFERFHSLISVD